MNKIKIMTMSLWWKETIKIIIFQIKIPLSIKILKTKIKKKSVHLFNNFIPGIFPFLKIILILIRKIDN